MVKKIELTYKTSVPLISLGLQPGGKIKYTGEINDADDDIIWNAASTLQDPFQNWTRKPEDPIWNDSFMGTGKTPPTYLRNFPKYEQIKTRTWGSGIGGFCSLDTDCAGYRVGQDGPACDTIQKTCAILHWPRWENEMCNLSTDCVNGIGNTDPNGLGCQANKCVKKLRDWAGFYYTPAECRGWFGAPLGTCGPVDVEAFASDLRGLIDPAFLGDF